MYILRTLYMDNFATSRLSHSSQRGIEGSIDLACMSCQCIRTLQTVVTLRSHHSHLPTYPPFSPARDAKMGYTKDSPSYLPSSVKPRASVDEANLDDSRRHITRRRIIAALILLFPITLLLRPVTSRYRPVLPTESKQNHLSAPQSVEERVRSILSQTPLIGTSSRPSHIYTHPHYRGLP